MEKKDIKKKREIIYRCYESYCQENNTEINQCKKFVLWYVCMRCKEN